MEDAACLEFLSSQSSNSSNFLNSDKGKFMDVIQKTIPKMSKRGKRLALKVQNVNSDIQEAINNSVHL